MRPVRRTLPLALAGLLALGAIASSVDANDQRPKPDFALRGVDGATHRLSTHRGKWVVLEWVNFDCAPVRDLYQAPRQTMQALQKAAMARGVVWLCINSTAAGKAGHLTPKQGQAALTRMGATPTAMLLDTTGAVGKQFRVRFAPEARVLSPRGDVVYVGGVDHLHTVLEAATTGRPIPFASKPVKGCRIAYATTTAARGPKAPEFTLRDTTGAVRRLSDYRGKWVILEWVNYDCPFVQKQYHFSHKTMQALQQRAARNGIVWLSICSSARGKQGHFSAAQANARMKKLGATPTAYLLDPSG
ncbi:MAG: redoxin domain-containing protein, partial [Planctomycetota bacterium]|nr:redoxin domain-containing protein [Planctomycetota bacterium]